MLFKTDPYQYTTQQLIQFDGRLWSNDKHAVSMMQNDIGSLNIVFVISSSVFMTLWVTFLNEPIRIVISLSSTNENWSKTYSRVFNMFVFFACNRMARAITGFNEINRLATCNWYLKWMEGNQLFNGWWCYVWTREMHTILILFLKIRSCWIKWRKMTGLLDGGLMPSSYIHFVDICHRYGGIYP